MTTVEERAESGGRGVSEEVLRGFFREMLLIRRFEEKVEDRFRAGELPGLPARRDRPGGDGDRCLRRARRART